MIKSDPVNKQDLHSIIISCDSYGLFYRTSTLNYFNKSAKLPRTFYSKAKTTLLRNSFDDLIENFLRNSNNIEDIAPTWINYHVKGSAETCHV